MSLPECIYGTFIYCGWATDNLLRFRWLNPPPSTANLPTPSVPPVAFHRQQVRAGDDDGEALGAGDGDVETVFGEQKAYVARQGVVDFINPEAFSIAAMSLAEGLCRQKTATKSLLILAGNDYARRRALPAGQAGPHSGAFNKGIKDKRCSAPRHGALPGLAAWRSVPAPRQRRLARAMRR